MIALSTIVDVIETKTGTVVMPARTLADVLPRPPSRRRTILRKLEKYGSAPDGKFTYRLPE